MKSHRLNAFLLAVFISCVFFLAANLAFGGIGVHDGMGNMKETGVTASLTTEPEHVSAGELTTVRFSLNDEEGKPLQGLTLMHARYLHVVIVSQDFTVFAHIHPRDFERLTPEVLKGGRFFVKFTFPTAGRYVVGLDFAVKGRPVGRHFIVNVAGEPKMTSAKEDFSREEKADGLDVSFATTPSKITANKKAMLSYVFKKDGKPVTDLKPWLAAPMHLAIVSSDLKYFLHVHGKVPGMSSSDEQKEHMHMNVPARFGPRIEVPVVFPAKGLYEVFGQVGHGGEVILTKFMVRVE
jgi:Cu+-exporting ATPase